MHKQEEIPVHWTWLSKCDLKKEMEGLIMAAKLRPSLKNEGYK